MKKHTNLKTWLVVSLFLFLFSGNVWAMFDCGEYEGTLWCDSWENPRQCYGDTDGSMEGGAVLGYHYVGVVDLGVLQASWGTSYYENMGIGYESGADFNRDGYINQDDLDIMDLWYMVKEPTMGPGVPADCPVEFSIPGIPTVSQWGMIVLGVLVLACGAAVIRYRLVKPA